MPTATQQVSGRSPASSPSPSSMAQSRGAQPNCQSKHYSSGLHGVTSPKRQKETAWAPLRDSNILPGRQMSTVWSAPASARPSTQCKLNCDSMLQAPCPFSAPLLRSCLQRTGGASDGPAPSWLDSWFPNNHTQKLCRETHPSHRVASVRFVAAPWQAACSTYLHK